MSVLKSYSSNLAVFWCPACQSDHPFHFADKNGNVASKVVWDFNHDFDKPTFSPSLLVHPHDNQPKCHSFVRDGKIEYCSDCDHDFAGKTVDMIPWSDEENYWKGQKDG